VCGGGGGGRGGGGTAYINIIMTIRCLYCIGMIYAIELAHVSCTPAPALTCTRLIKAAKGGRQRHAHWPAGGGMASTFDFDCCCACLLGGLLTVHCSSWGGLTCRRGFPWEPGTGAGMLLGLAAGDAELPCSQTVPPGAAQGTWRCCSGLVRCCGRPLGCRCYCSCCACCW
jgi:hypothetical protein